MATFSPSDIGPFAQHVLGMPLYPYQLKIAEAILDSIVHGRGAIITVMMARQSGKNQLSAVLEAFLLAHMEKGTIVKAAPTFSPQIQNSRHRLLGLLGNSGLGERVWQSHGRTIGLAPDAESLSRRNQLGPRVVFYSAAPESNVVGATADLLLEIDEAQNVAEEKFSRDFRPMASTTNATTVLYGTAWNDHTLLAQLRAVNLEQQMRGGAQRHFEYDWRTLAALNPRYRAYVEQEIARLGEEHPAIQTQYFLHSVEGADRLLNDRQLVLLQGEHNWQEGPLDGEYYVAALDLGGEDREEPQALIGLAQGKSRHDRTVISIARVGRNALQLPLLEVVHQESWAGMRYNGQLIAIMDMIERWGVRTLIVDGTGLGEPLVSLLREKFGEERIRQFKFTRPSKSRLAYQFISAVNGGQLKIYTAGSGTQERKMAEESWQQLRKARQRLVAPDVLNIYVDPAEGHDDVLISLALLSETISTVSMPAQSTVVRSRRLYTGEGRF